jgi:hypothetical protein
VLDLPPPAFVAHEVMMLVIVEWVHNVMELQRGGRRLRTGTVRAGTLMPHLASTQSACGADPPAAFHGIPSLNYHLRLTSTGQFDTGTPSVVIPHKFLGIFSDRVRQKKRPASRRQPVFFQTIPWSFLAATKQYRKRQRHAA